MTRKCLLAALMLAALCPPVGALGLRWSTGDTALTFRTATRCTLLVEAGEPGAVLPTEWYLIWAASSSRQITPLLEETPPVDVAVAATYEMQSAVEVASRTLTLRLRAGSPSTTTLARYVVDLQGSAAGRFQVVAVVEVAGAAPNVRRSDVVSFNGGGTQALPFVIGAGSCTHATTELSVHAAGLRLAAVSSARIVSPDASWSVPLTISARSDTSLEASAGVPTNLPTGFLEVEASDHTRATTVLEAAVVETEPLQMASFSLFTDPDSNVVTKDFALVFNRVLDPNSSPPKWRQLFHLVYQRSGGPQSSETHFGHAWSQDLATWTVDTNFFAVDATAWNARHVWAPSIVQHGPAWLMFYTGVDVNNDQRIGYVSAASLDTTNTVWSSTRKMVWEASNTGWAVPDPPVYSGQTQFRDPYVLEEPGSTGKLLLFFAAHDTIDSKANQGGLVTGIARSQTGTIDLWDDLGYYAFTQRGTSGTPQLEGPHVFPVNGTNSGWRLMFTNGGTPPGETGSTTLRFFKNIFGSAVTDTTRSHWGSMTIAQTYLGGGSSVFGWSGSDEIHVADNIDYLAGFTAWGPTDQGIAISRMAWSDSNFTLVSPSVTSVNEHRSRNAAIKLSLSGYSPHSHRVSFVIEAPNPTSARLDLYDAMGRHVRTLLHGSIEAKRTLVVWDLSTPAGGTAASGVYFARLAFDGGNRTAKFPIVR